MVPINYLNTMEATLEASEPTATTLINRNEISEANQVKPIAQRTRARSIRKIDVPASKKPSSKKTKEATSKKPYTRPLMTITNCKHTDAVHYAKGMCNHCYHINGRKTAGKATKCEHTDRPNYCKGLCMNCYINGYNKNKKRTRKS